MKKNLIFLALFLALTFTGCNDLNKTVEPIVPEITDVELLQALLVLDNPVPIRVCNQDKQDVTDDVQIVISDPTKAEYSDYYIKALTTDDVVVRVVKGDVDKEFTLKVTDGTSNLTDITIPIIQSASHKSPYVNMTVEGLEGIVTAKGYKSFYLQTATPDSFNATSEAIKVYTKSYSNPDPGTKVVITGKIAEYGSSPSNPTTQIIAYGDDWGYTENGTADIPAAVDLTQRVPPNKLFSASGDLLGNHFVQPDIYGLDFWESLEGMLVEISNARAVSPYGYGDFFVVNNNGSSSTLTSRGGLLLSSNDYNPEQICINVAYDGGNSKGDDWPVKVGDRFPGKLVAPVGFDTYFKCPILDMQYGDTESWFAGKVDSTITREASTIGVTKESNKLTIASFNIENFNTNSATDVKTVDLATTIVTGLNCPDIVALAEMLDDDGATKNDTGIVTAEQNAAYLIEAIGALNSDVNYKYVEIAPNNNEDGGVDNGNIRVAYLYNLNRVGLTNFGGSGDADDDIQVINSYGKISLNFNPVRIQDSSFDDSRKPLVASFDFNGETVIVCNVHFKSKWGDDPLFGVIQPPVLESEEKRTPQCQRVNDVVEDMLDIDDDANIIILGDFNDFTWSNPIKALMGSKFESLVDEKLPQNEHYSYVYMGNSQQLDHIIVSKNLTAYAEVDVVHRYSEFWDQLTDHDPTIASIVID